MERKERGITLISLVLTIIVMLILVAVSINVAVNGGLFKKAGEAVKKTEIAQMMEDLEVIKIIEDDDFLTGTMQEVFGDKYKKYNDVFTVEDGKLLYIGTNEETKQYAEDLGIYTLSIVPRENCWPLLATIAKVISNNDTITNRTKTATVEVGDTNYKLNVGDTFEVRYDEQPRTVRILGFNHDELSDETKLTAYGVATTTGKAGISFEFVDFMTGTTFKRMNYSGLNTGGWTATEMRPFLEGPDGIEKLSNKDQIKQVKKQYIKTYDTASSVTASNDKLWLLSCSEIWNNGYNNGYGGHGYVYAIAKEGEQYKYYADINPTSGSPSVSLVKMARGGSAFWWWTRSPYCGDEFTFCGVTDDGDCIDSSSSTEGGVAPGFSI